MKTWQRTAAAALMVLVFAFALTPAALAARDTVITTSPTGYTKAEDVEYVIVSGTVVNWGARGEYSTFLTTYAESYYTNHYSWDQLSDLDGGTGTSDAYTSQLYMALQDMMQAKHTKLQGYQDTRPYYQYTDCVANDYSMVSSFYSGNTVAGKWTGTTYNREHIWPKSKCINTNKAEDSADIMMLRATISSENSSRGNSAYGENGGYFDPGASVRGDCARMVLYGYVRWGNTGKMWGTGGVIESLDILLKWMEEDPVDTWEMGRNDAVQSITGVRNVFVDFPEYAWLLFGEEIPADLVTPSGNASQKPCTHETDEVRNKQPATCTEDGYTGDRYCSNCGMLIAAGEVIPAAGEHNLTEWITAPGGGSQSRWCSNCDYEETRDLPDCQHGNTEKQGKKAPTCTEDGYSGDTLCYDCGCFIEVGQIIPATGHQNILQETPKSATCSEDGYTGDKRCTDCGEVVEKGTVIPATGEHDFSEWITEKDISHRNCKICNFEEIKTESKKAVLTWDICLISAVSIIVSFVTTFIGVSLRKRKMQ